MLTTETVLVLTVLAAGVGWLLVRRRRVGPATWPAVFGLLFAGSAFALGNMWTLFWLGMLEARSVMGWTTAQRWGALIGLTIQVASVAGLATLAWAGRRRRVVAGTGLAVLLVVYIARRWWDSAATAWITDVVRTSAPGELPDLGALTPGLMTGGIALAVAKAAGLVLLVAAVRPQILVQDEKVALRGE